eukprot:CAMPEP_0119373692 /NCGR_PEP_ID=MMETSP1334-20130426/27131_1 /TAXON_ID=127549 /ORGANISM="Calcidiscus leptoporus, Strain RCC1130" /LENGTH=94 /DNA_ID=CAMNT_0007391545 /DNA_START=47 /DNA_END=332 /DNA_ORIENTATION=+
MHHAPSSKVMNKLKKTNQLKTFCAQAKIPPNQHSTLSLLHSKSSHLALLVETARQRCEVKVEASLLKGAATLEGAFQSAGFLTLARKLPELPLI